MDHHKFIKHLPKLDPEVRQAIMAKEINIWSRWHRREQNEEHYAKYVEELIIALEEVLGAK